MNTNKESSPLPSHCVFLSNQWAIVTVKNDTWASKSLSTLLNQALDLFLATSDQRGGAGPLNVWMAHGWCSKTKHPFPFETKHLELSPGDWIPSTFHAWKYILLASPLLLQSAPMLLLGNHGPPRNSMGGWSWRAPVETTENCLPLVHRDPTHNLLYLSSLFLQY